MEGIYRFVLLSFVLFFLNTAAEAQSQLFTEQDSVPLNSNIRQGYLSNGFQYFIKPTKNNSGHISLQLYSKSGANQEDEDQNDISHAVEHLAFKSTEHFPHGIKSNNNSRIGNLGMYDISADNGRSGTLYHFDIPSGDHEALEFAFLWYNDIISGLKLTEKDINQVRGELHQEVLIRVGDKVNDHFTESRLKSLLYPCASDRTDFFEHIKTFEPEVLRRFYDNWYRPDMMAISVVGDIENVDFIEDKIQNNFKDLPKTNNPRKPRDCDAEYYRRPPQFHVVERQRDTMKILQNNDVQTRLYYRDQETSQNLKDMVGLQRLLLIEMISSMMNKRFRESINNEQPYNVLASNPSNLYEFPPALELVIHADSKFEKEAMEKTILLINQLRTFGVYKQEWEKLKDQQLTHLNKNAENNKNRFWKEEISRFYLKGEALPDNKYDLLLEWLRNLNITEFNRFLKNFLSRVPEDIGIIAPANSKALSYTEQKVRSWIASEYNNEVEPYELPETPSSLMTTDEIHHLQEVAFQEIGIGRSGSKEVKLANGVKVIFKEVESNEKISIHGFSPIGADYFPKENYHSAINAPSILRQSGFPGISLSQLKRYLSTTKLGSNPVTAYISDQESGIKGRAPLEDLEILFQLIFLHFSAPTHNPVAFESWKLNQEKYYRNPSYELSHADFNNSISESLGERPGNLGRASNPLLGTARYEGAKQVDLNDAINIYRKLFSSSQNFTFIIHGDFNTDIIMPLVQKYMGNLPNHSSSLEEPLTRKENKTLPRGPKFTEIPSPEYYRMKEMIYGIRYFSRTDSPFDWKEHLKIEALGNLTSRVAWRLRFEKDYSIYHINGGGRFNRDKNRYEIFLTIKCLPEEFEALQGGLRSIISDIKSGKVSEVEYKQGLERMYYMYSPELANRAVILGEKLYTNYRYGQPWTDHSEVEAYLNSLTLEDIIATAKKYFKEENRYEFVMRDKEFQESSYISEKPMN